MLVPSPLQWLLALLLAACLSSFTWAMRTFFVKPERMTPGLRITLLSVVAFAIAHFVVLLRTPHLQLAAALSGIALYSAALAIFWWTIVSHRQQPLAACFSRDESLHLVQHGPYRYIRHPFYCSYLLTWLAGGIATLNPWLGLTFIAMFVLYLIAAHDEEKKFAASSLAEQYARYRRTTGQFFPSPWKLLHRA